MEPVLLLLIGFMVFCLVSSAWQLFRGLPKLLGAMEACGALLARLVGQFFSGQVGRLQPKA